MHRLSTAFTVLALFCSLSGTVVGDSLKTIEGSSKAIAIGSKLQLFLDDELIESMHDLELQLHSPRRAEVAIKKDKPWEDALGYWQEWYATTYPNHPKAKLPVESESGKWKIDDILDSLNDHEAAKGAAVRGESVFAKAQCIKCHRHGDLGEPMGPDLTTITRRFRKEEILEAVIHPSHVIPDQYAAQTIVTKQHY